MTLSHVHARRLFPQTFHDFLDYSFLCWDGVYMIQAWPAKAGHRIGLYCAGLGHESSTQKRPRVTTVWLVLETGNFMTHICSSSPTQPSVWSLKDLSYPELHPRKLNCSINHGTCPEHLKRRTSRNTESIFPPRQRRLLP